MKRMHAWYGRIVQLLLLLATAGTVAMAAVPSPPANLKATVYNQGNGPYVMLTWEHKPSSPNSNDMDVIDVYQKSSTDGFSKVSSVIDSIPQYGFYSSVLSPGTYSFYVVATNKEGSSDPSETVTVTISDKAIRFMAAPASIDTATVAVEYKATLEGMSSNGEEVRYSVVGGPGVIDPVTGAYSFTPKTAGYVTVRVKAVLVSDPNVSATYSWTVLVLPDQSLFCSTIYGMVTDATSGKPISGGLIYAYPSDSLNGGSMASVRLTNGFYELKLLSGAYRLYLIPDGDYSATWYSNASSASDAKIVMVKCDSVAANFSLEGPSYDVVSGRVTRKSDGAGVLAEITFTTGSYVSGGPYHSDTIKTDADGYYSISVLHGRKYAAVAYALDGLLAQQFYKDANTFEQATLIQVDGDLTGIDFVLKNAADVGGVIVGNVVDSVGKGLYAEIQLFKVSEINGQALGTPVATTVARSGQFSLYNLDKGAYIVFVIPGDSVGAYAPGYYRKDDFAARTWQKGTRVVVTPSQNAAEQITIKIDGINGTHGFSNLKGHITMQKGQIKQDGGSTQGAAPLEGATVYAIDAEDQVNGYAVTDVMGEFEIDGLSVGTYSVVVDKVGYEGSIESVTIASDGESTSIDVPMTEVGGVSGVAVGSRVEATLSAYPNPAHESMTLKFQGVAGMSRIRMVDASGSEVMSREVKTEAGANSLRIEANGLSSGVYYVRIESGDMVGTVQVTILR